ncbi:MAG: hypothetical protein ACYSWP_20155 [Planctomycetota bacterium]|jgi:hypothetical protein
MDVTGATINPICQATGTEALGQAGVSDPTLTHSVGAGSVSRSPSTAVPVTKSWEGEVALVAGTATIDLTALDRGNLSALDLSGEKIQAIHVRGDNANTGPIEIDVAASNGHDLHGSGASSQICAVEADDEVLILKNDNGPAVSTTQAEFTLTGTGTEKVHIMILAGS